MYATKSIGAQDTYNCYFFIRNKQFYWFSKAYRSSTKWMIEYFAFLHIALSVSCHRLNCSPKVSFLFNRNAEILPTLQYKVRFFNLFSGPISQNSKIEENLNEWIIY